MVRAFSYLIVGAVLAQCAFGSLLPRAAAQGEEAKKAAIQELLLKAEDEYRLFFHKPKTPFEFWAAIDFEIKTGKYDVASLLLDQLVKLQPKDKVNAKLLEIEEVKGMSDFLKLQSVKQWHKNPSLQKEAEKNVKELIDRVTVSLEQYLSDPVRINKLIDQLEAPSLPERAWAFKQLVRTKYRAAPYLVDALVKSVPDPKKHNRIKEAMLLLDADILPPLLEILKPSDDADYKDRDLRMTILEIFRIRHDPEVAPYLWHMMASPKYPPMIRAQAKKTLAWVLDTPEDNLPDPRYALTDLAEKYYHHQVKFRHVLYDPKSEAQYIKFWPWHKGQVLEKKFEIKSVSEAERFFAMRHAKEALDLDPNFKPAQRLLLTMILDQAYAKGLDQFLLKPMPADLEKLLITLDSQLLMEVLQQAYNEHNTAVILPLVQVLGERGDLKAALPTASGQAQGLLKGLYYPDPRVQITAIRALVYMPGEKSPTVKTRIVELLQQFLLTEPVSQALVIHTPEGQEKALRDVLKGTGHEAVLAPDRKTAFAALHHNTNIDFILIHPSYPPEDLPFLVSELRADASAGQLPILIPAPTKVADKLKPAVAKYAHVYFLPEGMLGAPPALKIEMENAYKLAKAPTFLKDVPESQKPRVLEDYLNTKGIALSEVERKVLSLEAMDLLWKMGFGTIKDFSLVPAKATLLAATQNKDLAEKATDTLGTLPGTDVQQRLAALTLDNAVDKKVRWMAAYRLHQHILKHGLVLNPHQIGDLRVAAATVPDPELRKQLLLVASTLPKSGTGSKLSEYSPTPPGK